MKIITDQSLTKFEFWSQAARNADKLTNSELHAVAEQLEELYPDGIDETTLNDIFWFDFDMICSWLGYQYTEYGEVNREPTED